MSNDTLTDIPLVNKANPYNSAVNNLSKGVITLYSLPVLNVDKQLKELTTKQEFIISQIHNENMKLSQVQYSPEIQETFVKLKVYHNKLLNLKKDMKLIYERSTKLKKRALLLQQIREKRQQNKIQSEPVVSSSSSSNNS